MMLVVRNVELRLISPDDAHRLAAFHERLSAETIRRRYFTPHPVLSPDEIHRFTHVDGEERLAVVAVLDDEIVGVGRYESLPGTGDAEVAFVVRDDVQGQGIGTRLVERIRDEAAAHGKRRLVAETLPENTAMRRAFRHLGPEVTQVFRGGVVEVVIPLNTALPSA